MNYRPRPIFKYYGSKWSKAKLYEAPKYSTIIEPYAGSASYSIWHMLHGWDGNIVLCDSNPRIANLWRWLNEDPWDYIWQLPTSDLVVGEDLEKLPVIDPAVELIARWQRVGGNSCRTVSKWNCTSGQWGQDVKFHLSKALKIIKGRITVYDSIDQIENVKATWFVDPPYCDNVAR